MEPGDDVAAVTPLRSTDDDGDALLNPGEVARMFGVDPKTVARWADAGKIDAIRTLGGHRRYRPADVRALLATESGEAADPRASDAGDDDEADQGLRPAAR